MATKNLAAFPLPAPSRLRGAAASVPLPAASPLRLDRGAAGWLIERGAIDLFAVALAEDEPVGMRRQLCSLAAGELLLALPKAVSAAVIGVGQRDTSVIPLGEAELAALPLQQRTALIEAWIVRIAAALFGETVEGERAGEPGPPMEIAAAQRLHALRGVIWAVPQSGTLTLADSDVSLTGAMPIAAGLSLRAATNCVVEFIDTAEALERGFDAARLGLFHHAILTAVTERIEQAETREQQRIAARAAVDQRSLGTALRQLAAVAGAAAHEPAAKVGSNPLTAAFAAVAAHHGIALTRTPRLDDAAAPSIRVLARANGIGTRQVLLREAWWRRDNGPLLGWRGDARDPVALLPAGNRSYRVWDPASDLSAAVDERIAGEIAPQALALYRPMPETVRGVAALVGFGGRGTGRDLASVLVAGLLGSAVAALLPLAIGYLFGSAVPRAEAGQVVAVILGLLLAALGAGIFDLTRAVALLRLEGRLEAALQPALMQRLVSLPVKFYRGFGTGELMNRVLSIQNMRRLLAGNLLVSLLSALFAMTSLVVILAISPFLASLSGGVVALAGLLVGALAYAELRQERARIKLRGEEDGLLVQVLQGIVKLRVAAGEARIFAVWASLFARQKRHFLIGRRYGAAGEVLAEIYPILAMLVLFFAGSRLLKPGQTGTAAIGLAGFLAVNAAFGQLLAATIGLSRAVATALDLVPLFERLRPILDAAPETRSGKSEAPPLSGRIEMSHVSFRYTAGTAPVLDDISLRIEPGSLVAFVGASGSGKSTLFRLLLGFESAEAGDILYDGQSIGTLDAATLRQQIGVVLQHSRVTTGSIFDNITSGLPYTLADAWRAARLAGIDADIEAMPMGMHTLLMEGTSTLSGGQRQRLMIARALIGQPRIVLFDEATSALDNRSQAVVMRSLERLSATRIVIAHRLSTVEHADRIFVLDHGRVVEAGSYAELVAADGPFSRLARRQIL